MKTFPAFRKQSALCTFIHFAKYAFPAFILSILLFLPIITERFRDTAPKSLCGFLICAKSFLFENFSADFENVLRSREQERLPSLKKAAYYCIIIAKILDITIYLHSRTVMRVPKSGRDRISMIPLWASTIHLAMERPSPVPPWLLFLAASDR